MPTVLSSLFIAAISGFATYFLPGHDVWQQWTYLLHSFSGLLLSVVIFPFIVIHFRRTLGLRRPAVLLTGLVVVGAALALLATGVHVALVGHREALRWVYHVHIVAAFVVALTFLGHLIGHRVLMPTRRKETETRRFPSITSVSLKMVAWSGIAAATFILGATILYQLAPSTYRDEAVIKPYETTYGPHPFRPSQTETTTGGFVDERRIAGSEKCGVCHAQIANEWAASMHAQAASDKAYQTNINLLAKKKGMTATRYCEGCHAPVALLTGQLSAGGKLDTHGHMHEGVSCLTCHGIDRIAHLKGVGSYVFKPPTDYLFAERDNFLANKLHNYLIRIHPDEHRRTMAKPVLQSPQLCATCHAQFMDKEVNNWGWVKMQDDYSGWLKGPYSGQSDHAFAHRQMTRCQDCHMPRLPGEDPSADKNGLVSAHRWPGANTAIPAITKNVEQLAVVTRFLQEDKIRVAIEEPNRARALRSGRPINPEVALDAEAPGYFYLGETAQISVIVSNVGVGHDFPGGTSDINEAWVHFRVVDAQDRLVYESGGIVKSNSNNDPLDPLYEQKLNNNDVDPKAHFYRSLMIDRSGKHVWRHDLFNMIGDSYKKVIPAGGSDIVHYRFKIPTWAKGALTATAVVRYRKLNNRYARWALKDINLVLPIVDMARDSINLPVRQKPEIVVRD